MVVVDTEDLASRTLPPVVAPPDHYGRSLGADGYRTALEREMADHPSNSPAAPSLVGHGAGSTSERDAWLTPAAIGPIVDSLLTGALRRLDAEVEAARAESEAAVAGAMQKAPSLLLSIGSPEERRAERRTAVMATSRPPAPPVVNDAGDAAGCAKDPQADPWIDAPPMATDAFGLDTIDLREPADVYEQFWADASEDRPVLDRLRRWARQEV